MIVLINTCGSEATVALSDGPEILAQESVPGREASERSVAALRRLLAAAGALEAVAVVHGPGSFTGVRVGLSAAKGLCEARGVGMIAMSRLQLVALQAQRLRETPRQDEVLAVLDAGRGEFFCGFYRGDLVEREEILGLEALLARARGRSVSTCEPKVHAALSARLEVTLAAEPGPAELLRVAQARIAAGEWSDVATIDANYLRRTDAELLAERR